MDRATHLDLIRAWVEGELPPQETRQLELELERDPELAELAERFRDVHGLTSVESEPPPLTLTFEGLEHRLRREQVGPRPRWRAAAAAVLLAGAGAGTWALLADPRADGEGVDRAGTAQAPPSAEPAGADPGADEPAGGSGELAAAAPRPASVPTARAEVRLASIDFAPAPEKDYVLAVPAGLAEYEPRGESGIQWFEDWREARFVAFAAGRPLLVFGTKDDCEDCELFAREILAEPGVLDLIDLFVPMRWDLTGENGELLGAMSLERRGDPLVEIWTADEVSVTSLSRADSPELFEELMLQGLERIELGERLPDWDDVRALAARYDRARAARSGGRLGELQTVLLDLRRRARGGPFAEVAAYELSALGREAGASLQRARELAEFDPEGARASLERAATRFAETSFEGDLRAVLDAWPRDGAFPVLVPAGS